MADDVVEVPDVPLTALLGELDTYQQSLYNALREMGFEREQALRLVYAQAPWFRIKIALHAGCTLEQAIAIWA